jgi:hypothetical protein
MINVIKDREIVARKSSQYIRRSSMLEFSNSDGRAAGRIGLAQGDNVTMKCESFESRNVVD